MDMNVQDVDGNTPLHYAVQHAHIESLAVLLEFKANMAQTNAQGHTPQDYIAMFHNDGPEAAQLHCTVATAAIRRQLPLDKDTFLD